MMARIKNRAQRVSGKLRRVSGKLRRSRKEIADKANSDPSLKAGQIAKKKGKKQNAAKDKEKPPDGLLARLKAKFIGTPQKEEVVEKRRSEGYRDAMSNKAPRADKMGYPLDYNDMLTAPPKPQKLEAVSLDEVQISHDDEDLDDTDAGLLGDSSLNTHFKVGDYVQAQWAGDGHWYGAMIMSVHINDTMTVEWSDGTQSCRHVNRNQVRDENFDSAILNRGNSEFVDDHSQREPTWQDAHQATESEREMKARALGNGVHEHEPLPGSWQELVEKRKQNEKAKAKQKAAQHQSIFACCRRGAEIPARTVIHD